MAERKTKRNARASKRHDHFRISREPVVHLVRHARPPDVGAGMLLPRVYDRPILFALARDERTIFVSWNIDWPGIFRKSMPADRQVYLRVRGSDGSAQKSEPVEPMLAMHYLTTSGLYGPHRVEIGYYQPPGTWHSVAISDEVRMPQQGSAGIAGIDLATIPFHLGFQQLVDLFGAANDTPLAKIVSKFQSSALNSQPNELPPAAKQVLRKLNLSLPAIAAARRDFEKSDAKKLVGHSRALLQFGGTSPSRGFEKNAGL
jgi:hypothetical protein